MGRVSPQSRRCALQKPEDAAVEYIGEFYWWCFLAVLLPPARPSFVDDPNTVISSCRADLLAVGTCHTLGHYAWIV